MPTSAHIPAELRGRPFRGSTAIASGLLTTSQLRGRAWRRLFPDVYISAEIEMNHQRWCEAAVIYAGPRGRMAISGRSAAYLMGIDLLPLGDPPVTVTVPQTQRLRPATSRLVVIRCELDLTDITGNRLPRTTPARTAFDLARLLPFREAVAAMDALLHQHLITLPEMRHYSVGAPSARWVRNVDRVLSAADSKAESPMETLLRLTIIDDGLPRPESQVNVYSADGAFIGRLDLAYRAAKIGIEYEGDHHRDRKTFRKDIRRYNAMREANWTIVRVTADDLSNPTNFLRQIRSLLREAGE